MYYTVYKITNLINSKIYIGVHKTSNLDDGYFGSGRLIRKAITKYGIENFVKEILFYFENEYDMLKKEAEIVTESFVNDDSNYNLTRGGRGSFYHIHKKTKEDENFRSSQNEKWRINFRKATEVSMKNNPNGIFYGKFHSEETKLKMRSSAIGKHDGKKNSQYGTMWINNGEKNKKIKKGDQLPEGWVKGRIV